MTYSFECLLKYPYHHLCRLLVFLGTIFLQQAETVRLVAPVAPATATSTNNHNKWKVLPVTDAKVGDKIYMIMHEMGTHVGKRINARVSEI